MPLLSRAETQFLRRHLDHVCHITLDPEGPGALRIHLVPSRHQHTDVPFVAILNGKDILPLSVSWAILLANLMETLQPFEGQEIGEEQWQQAADAAVQATCAVYKRTPPEQIAADLRSMMEALSAIARGKAPAQEIQPMDLGSYARHMAAPHALRFIYAACVLSPGSRRDPACRAFPRRCRAPGRPQRRPPWRSPCRCRH